MSNVIESLKSRYPQVFESVLKDKVIKTEISPGDGMFRPGQEAHYFATGLDALQNILSVLSQAKKTPRDVQTILDFACGHGRVTRMLRVAFPHARLSVSDIDSKGLSFCAKTFQAEPVLSSRVISEIRFNQRYDLIWCGSLLTHVDAPQWADVLRFFNDHLSAQGIMVFTTHGRYVANRLRQRSKLYNLSEEQVVGLLKTYNQHGFGYSSYKNGIQYGISVATPSWVMRQIEHRPALRLLTFVERGWDQHQDVVACRKVTDG